MNFLLLPVLVDTIPVAEVPDASEPNDSAMVQACVRGDTAAFRLLYRRHQSRVRSVLVRLGDLTVLDDLVQEVFVRAWQGLPKLRHSHQFSTWLYRIAWNVAVDSRRRAIRHRDHLQDFSPEALEQLASPTPATPDLLQLHYQDLVARGLEHLSLEHRAVLVLHDLEALPQKQISEILNIPVGTVKSRLFHARAALRQFFKQAGVLL